MIVSHRHKYIFLKPLKVAGTSMELWLAKSCGETDIITAINPGEMKKHDYRPQNDQGFFNHISPKQLSRKLDKDIWNRYFKFTVVRNPWDTAVSYYWWYWWRIRKEPSFAKGLLQRQIGNERFYFDRRGNEVVDFYVRFEHLQEDCQVLADRFGIEAIELVRAKGSHRKPEEHYSKYFSTLTKNIVSQRNFRTIENFGYRFEGESNSKDNLTFMDYAKFQLSEPAWNTYHWLRKLP